MPPVLRLFLFLFYVQKTSIILNVALVPFIFFVLIALTFLLEGSFLQLIN